MADRERVEQIYHAARELAGTKREVYLAAACGHDEQLRTEVDELLVADVDAGSFLCPGDTESKAKPGALTSMEYSGLLIGRYKLLQPIGEGGFGTVWMAEQREPVKRRVALKVIKLGMDTKQVIARFEAERQALAMMDHPNIAKVLDAGATATGRPYFVMEYIRGEAIIEYCDREQLDPRARLELFVQVCMALQHAHQKGVIHRDIKPNNVIVTMHDGVPVPKVIDFGIAKATNFELTQKTLFTEHQQMIGTPAYMSPEQAEMSGLDIDTRTDVYSLGVLLYELLTGSTPFPNDELLSKGFVEMMRVIREVDPPKPSTRLSQSSESLASIAARRRTEPAKLGTLVRGELDWIVMKALEKNRMRRYESANRLALDVRQYLAGEPLEAAPPSVWYQLRKTVRRNKAAVTPAALVALALLVGVVGFAWQASVAQVERDAARDERNKAIASEAAALSMAEELRQVSEFQSRILNDIGLTPLGGELTADVTSRHADALERAGVEKSERDRLQSEFKEAWNQINATDVALGIIDRAVLRPSVETLDREYMERPVIDSRLRQALADRYREFGLFKEAMPLQRRALETRRRELGANHPETLESLTNMGFLLQRSGRLAEVEPFWLAALDGRRSALGDDHSDTIASMTNLAWLYTWLGRYADAEPYVRESLDGLRLVLGDEHGRTLGVMALLGRILWLDGRPDEAETLLREALEGRRRILGESHANTIITMAWLASVLDDQGKSTEAQTYFYDAIDKYERALAQDKAEDLRGEFQPMGGLSQAFGRMLGRMGRFGEAERFYHDSLEKKRQTLGQSHQYTITALIDLASNLIDEGRVDEAEPFVLDALQKSQQALGIENEQTRRALTTMGRLQLARNEPAEAEPYFARSLELNRRLFGGDHLEIAFDLCQMAIVHDALGRPEEARAGFDEAIAMHRRITPRGSARLARVLWRSGLSRLESGDAAAAIPELEEALELASRFLARHHPYIESYRETLATCSATFGE